MNRQFDSLARTQVMLRGEESTWGEQSNPMLRSRHGPDAGIQRNMNADLRNKSVLAGRSLYGDFAGDEDMQIHRQPNSFSHQRSPDFGQGRFSDRERMSTGAWDRYSEEPFNEHQIVGTNQGNNDFDYCDGRDVSKQKFRGLRNSADLTVDKYCDRFPMRGGVEVHSHDNLNYSDERELSERFVEDDFPRKYDSGSGLLNDAQPLLLGANQSSRQKTEDSWLEERFVEEDEMANMDWQQVPNNELGLINKRESYQQPHKVQENYFTDSFGNRLTRSFQSDPHPKSINSFPNQQSPLMAESRVRRSPTHASGRRSPSRRRDRSPRRSSDRSRRDSPDRLRSRRDLPDRLSRSRRDSPNRSRSKRDSLDGVRSRDSSDRFRSSRDSPDRLSRSRRDSSDRPSRHSARRWSPTAKDKSNFYGNGARKGFASFSATDAPESVQNEPEPVSISFVKGMICPVCKNKYNDTTFPTVAKFRIHWKKYHSKFRMVYSCPMQHCFESFAIIERLLSHVKKEHNKGLLLSTKLENFIRKEIKCSKVEKKPEIDPGNLTFDPVDKEEVKEVKKSSLTREAAIVESLLTPDAMASLPQTMVHPFPADPMATDHPEGYWTPVQPQDRGFRGSLPYPEVEAGYPGFNMQPTPGTQIYPEASIGLSFPGTYQASELDQPGPSGFGPPYNQAGKWKKNKWKASAKSPAGPNSFSLQYDQTRQMIEHSTEGFEQNSSEVVPIVFQSGMICPICPNSKKCFNFNDYRNHWYSYHVQHFDRYQCPRIQCPVFANSQPSLRKHYKKTHNNGEELVDTILQMLNAVECKSVTNENFVNPGRFTFDETQGKELVQGLTTNTDETVASQSGEIAQGQTTTLVFQSNMKCPACPKSKRFTFEYDFKMHWQLRHIKIVDRYACPVEACITKTGSIKFLRKHYRKFHAKGAELTDADLFEINKVKCERGKNPIFLDPGNYTFDSGKVELNEDEEPEESDPVVIEFECGMRCPICRKTTKFSKAFDYRNHWLLTHVKVHERFSCPYTGCSGLLSSQLKLFSHYKRLHNDDDDLSEETVNMLSAIQKSRENNPMYINPGKYTFDYDNEDVRKQNFDHVYKQVKVDEEVMET